MCGGCVFCGFFGVLWFVFVLLLFCFVFCPGHLLLQSWELGKQNETKQKTKEKNPKTLEHLYNHLCQIPHHNSNNEQL